MTTPPLPPDLRIGISGWTYAGWRKVFYPEGLPHRLELEYASRRMGSIEINGSFYSLQRPSSYARWHDETPDDFVFAVKGGRFLTHMLKLKEVRVPLANFLASGVLRLGTKLGPLLWQFPPQLRYLPERFADFLEMLPRTMAEASRLAEENSIQLPDRVWTEAVCDGPIRHCFEIRHPTFLVPDFVDLLRAHGAALVFADTAGLFPYAEDLTADFVYIRLHGGQELYQSRYTDEELDWWAERIRLWRAGSAPTDGPLAASPAPPGPARDVYVYFDNDAKVHAPFDAIRLRERLEGGAG